MADEYINKTELLFEMATSLIPQSMDITRGYAIAKDLIRKAPTTDVAPVIHGEWIHKNGEMYCSVCGSEALMDEVYYKSPYCPDCGARMDGGKKNG